jgi:hypothetical protein
VRALAHDSSQELDFPESNLLQGGSRNLEKLLRFIEAALAWFSSPLEHLNLRKKCSLINPAQKSIRVVLITAGAPENPPGNHRLTRTRTDTIFKKFCTKTILKSKINLIRIYTMKLSA